MLEDFGAIATTESSGHSPGVARRLRRRFQVRPQPLQLHRSPAGG
jgi:hypothetical protein